MPIELICKGCSRKLRVGEEHAGKHARCPQCGEINPISSSAAVSTGSSGSLPPAPITPNPLGSSFAPPAPQQPPRGAFSPAAANPPPSPPFSPWEPTAPGQPFGRPDGSSDRPWEPAAPAPSAESFATSSNPFTDRPASAWSPGPTDARPAYQQPHRGALILIFGLLGWVVCLVFGVLAWVWGAEDLRQMRRGLMDPSGMGLTQAGMILGIVQCALFGLGVAAFVLLMIIGMAAR